MRDEVTTKTDAIAAGFVHPSSFRPHPFLSDAAPIALDRQDQRRSLESVGG